MFNFHNFVIRFSEIMYANVANYSFHTQFIAFRHQAREPCLRQYKAYCAYFTLDFTGCYVIQHCNNSRELHTIYFTSPEITTLQSALIMTRFILIQYIKVRTIFAEQKIPHIVSPPNVGSWNTGMKVVPQ